MFLYFFIRFDFVGRVGALHVIFYNVIDDPLVGFVSKGELVFVENSMGEAIGCGRLSRNETPGRGEGEGGGQARWLGREGR